MNSWDPHGVVSIALAEGIGTHWLEDDLLVSSPGGTQSKFRVPPGPVRERLRRLCEGAIAWPIRGSLGVREATLFRLVETNLARRRLLSYTFSVDGNLLASMTASPLLGKPAIWREQQAANLAPAVAVIDAENGKCDVINARAERAVSLSSRGAAALWAILSGTGIGDLERSLAGFMYAQEMINQGDEHRREQSEGDWSALERIFHFSSRQAWLRGGMIVSNASLALKESSRAPVSPSRDSYSFLLGRKSRRGEGRPLRSEDLVGFLSLLLKEHVDDEGDRRRLFPAAGGIYSFGFTIVVNTCSALVSGAYRVSQSEDSGSIHFRELSNADRECAEVLSECAVAWGLPECKPQAVVLISLDGRALVRKYGAAAYRLALLDAGAILNTMELACEVMRLNGCALGLSSSSMDALGRVANPGHITLAAFAVSGGRGLCE